MEEKGPDRQTARIAPRLSSQNTHTANRQTRECISVTPFASYFLSSVDFWHQPVTSFPRKTVVTNQIWLYRTPTGMGDTRHTTVLDCSVLFSRPYVTSPVVGMCGDWDGRSMKEGKRPHCGVVKNCQPGTQDSRARQRDSWLPHWGETVQFPHEDTADVVANNHVSRYPVKVLNQKYPRHFLGVSAYISVCTQRKEKAILQ